MLDVKSSLEKHSTIPSDSVGVEILFFRGGGDCNKVSHQTQCCHSDFKYDLDRCGWIYDSYGVKITCPKGTVY